MYKWLGDAGFRAALAQAEGEAVAQAGRRLATLAGAALDALAGTLTDAQTPAAVKVRAAEAILGHLLRYRETVQFEQRLDALEREMRGEHA